jgi:formyl-CoA transferase
VQDPRYANIKARRKNQADMWRIIGEFASSHTKWELMEVLNEINVPCGPIMSTKDLAHDTHVALREMTVKVPHPERGDFLNIGCPIKLSDSPVAVERSPLLGEHTEIILREILGYDSDHIEHLHDSGAFTKVPPKIEEYHELRA